MALIDATGIEDGEGQWNVKMQGALKKKKISKDTLGSMGGGGRKEMTNDSKKYSP